MNIKQDFGIKVAAIKLFTSDLKSTISSFKKI